MVFRYRSGTLGAAAVVGSGSFLIVVQLFEGFKIKIQILLKIPDLDHFLCRKYDYPGLVW